MTCVKTYWPAYIGAPAIQTSRRGRKTSEKIQVDNARKRNFTEKYQLVMLSSRNNVGTPVFTDYCEHLAKLPGMMGRPRPELGHDVRSTTFGNYVIFLRYA